MDPGELGLTEGPQREARAATTPLHSPGRKDGVLLLPPANVPVSLHGFVLTREAARAAPPAFHAL